METKSKQTKTAVNVFLAKFDLLLLSFLSLQEINPIHDKLNLSTMIFFKY